MLSVIEHGLATHDHVLHAFRALHPARRAARAVARDLVLRDVDPIQIEDHEVGHHALAHEAAVIQAHDARGLEGVAANRVLEGEELPLAHPLAEHVARLAGGAEVRVEMRAGVGLRRMAWPVFT